MGYCFENESSVQHSSVWELRNCLMISPLGGSAFISSQCLPLYWLGQKQKLSILANFKQIPLFWHRQSHVLASVVADAEVVELDVPFWQLAPENPSKQLHEYAVELIEGLLFKRIFKIFNSSRKLIKKFMLKNYRIQDAIFLMEFQD